AWYESATPSSRGRPQRSSDLAITTVLVIKRVFRLTLRAAQGQPEYAFNDQHSRDGKVRIALRSAS
ncbi:transposase, partial [Enterobacter cloacae]|uniref:transposase n=1 Tax=Enterobacter cloacae TaxID=550 RepID=UPI003C2F7353